MTTSSDNPNLDQRLSQLEADFTEFRQQQRQGENRLDRLEVLVGELSDIAQLHQQGLRLSQETFRRNDEQFREMREDIQQIWQYLVGQQNN